MELVSEALKATFTGVAYVGRKTLRADDEPQYRGNDSFDSREEYRASWPEANPHVFIKTDEGMSFADALVKPSTSLVGSSSVVVDYQSLVRDKSTPAEVDAWRERFTPEYFGEFIDGHDIDNLTDEDLTDVAHGIMDGAPFVILDADDIELGVPKQVSDMKRQLENIAQKQDLDLGLSEKSDTEIRNLFESLQSLM